MPQRKTRSASNEAATSSDEPVATVDSLGDELLMRTFCMSMLLKRCVPCMNSVSLLMRQRCAELGFASTCGHALDGMQMRSQADGVAGVQEVAAAA